MRLSNFIEAMRWITVRRVDPNIIIQGPILIVARRVHGTVITIGSIFRRKSQVQNKLFSSSNTQVKMYKYDPTFFDSTGPAATVTTTTISFP
jgi:hypothetical protein